MKRREVLQGALAVGLTGALAACDPGAEPPPAPPGTPLGSTADIPVGGGTVLSEIRIVVTHPSQGQFRAFSAVCPHTGCTVRTIADGVIICPCHGSRFSIEDGSVQSPPSPAPLTPRAITIVGGTSTGALITLA